ncbi:MAG: hypothetical protein JWN34_936 [Bryobacterales bacterium]|nr:hypothetical protein [Bryobacterales bacterium]
MTVVNPRFSYYCVHPVAEEDLRQYLHEPIEAIPAAAAALLPKVAIVLAPFLERPNAKGFVSVATEKPVDDKLVLSAAIDNGDSANLFFTIKDEQVADYHYFLYDELAGLLTSRLTPLISEPWQRMLREELSAEVHGEVDERSWRQKQTLLRRPMATRRDGKPFRDYARDSFHDTMTLFLHGICCDIDVETGPRQIPSRFLRKRLELLRDLFPPPEGHGVFPEDLHATETKKRRR